MTTKELQILLSLSQEISNSWNDDKLFEVLVNRISPIFGFDDMAINIWENESISFKLVSSSVLSEGLKLQTFKLEPYKIDRLEKTPYHELKSLKEFSFIDLDLWRQKYGDFTEVKLLSLLGFVEQLVLPLWKNDTVIGVVQFFSTTKGLLQGKNIDLFRGAADQLSIAVLKVLSNYELARQKSEKQILLDFAEKIPAINRRQELKEMIQHKIQPLFNFDAVELYLVRHDAKYHWNMMSENIPLITIEKTSADIDRNKLVIHNNSPVEWLIDNSEQGGVPVLFDFNYLSQAFPNYYASLPEQFDYRSSLSTNIKLKGKVIGALCIHSSNEGFFKEKDFTLFQVIADQISIALQRIINSEQESELHTEKEIILSISEEISKSRSKKQLFKTVSKKIQPLFGFHDMGLFILLENGKYHEDLAIEAPSAHNSAWNRSLAEISIGKIVHKDTPIEYIIDEVTKANRVLLFDNEDLYSRYPNYIQFQSSEFKNATYRDCMATTLKVGTEVIGMFCINSLKADFFTKDKYSLFQAIADQMAVAVSNILANEELLKSEKEKSLQLAIADVFSEEGEWEEKFNKIPALLADHIPFKILSFSFLMQDVDDDRSFRFIKKGDGYEVLKDKSFYKTSKSKKSDFLEHRHSLSLRSSTWYDEEQLTLLEKTSPFTKKFRNAYGINSVLFENIELNKGNRLILMTLDEGSNTYQKKYIDLFKKLKSSFALPIEKLLAYEEIVLHKQEKEELLKLSEKLATIRNRKELLDIIKGPLKDLFQYDDIVISINSEDLKYHWLMVSAVLEETSLQQRYHSHRTQLIKNDMAYQKVIESNQPIIFSYDDLEQLGLPEEDLAMIKKSGLKQVVGVVLKQGGKHLGSIFMLAQNPIFSKKKFDLYKNTADQIAIAVSNVLNNEEILTRQAEKEIMLKISQRINQTRSRNDIIKLMNSELKELFSFEFASLIFYEDDQDDYVQWVVNPTSELEELEAFQQIQKKTRLSKDSFYHDLLEIKDISCFSTLEISQKYPLYPGVELYETYGLKSLVVIPLQYANKSLGLWLFNAKQENLLDMLNISLLENTSAQLAIAVSSLLANEEIVRREKMRSWQIKIQEAFDAQKGLADKLRETVFLLSDILPFDYISFNIKIPNEADLGLGFQLLADGEMRMITAAGFANLAGLTNHAFEKLKGESRHEKSQYFNGGNFKLLCEDNELISLVHKKFGANSFLTVPLKLSQKGVFGINFFSRKKQSYDRKHLSLLSKLENAFSIGFEKYFAQEEIIRLNQQLHQEKEYLAEEININYNFGELVGESSEIKKVFNKIKQVANTDTTVLVTGETGTGKEVIARAIHNSSSRKNRPLIKLNCAALPPQLIESELFGHEKGSFTGATSRRIGKFELANKGTIFLDEIGEMPLELQAKLLRVLQEKEIERIGGNAVIKVDVRIITATNRNLLEEIDKNTFRSDLFYRLNVFPVHIPPLRERRDDVIPLVNHFIKIKSKRIGKNIDGMSPESSWQLLNYDWPGNIRELEHIIERGLILSRGNTLRINLGEEMTFAVSNENQDDSDTSSNITPFRIRTIMDVEKELIVNTLVHTQGRVRGNGGAAQLLGIKPTTLEARMKKLGIKKKVEYQQSLN